MADNATWLAPLRERPFRTWVVGRGLSNIGSAVTTVLVPLVAVVALHATASVVSLIVASNLAAIAVGRPLGSLFAERSKRRLRVLLGLDLAACIVVLAVPALYFAGALTVALFWVLSVGNGFLAGTFGAYAAPVITELVDDEHLGQANGILGSSSSVASVVGPAIAAGLLTIVAAPVAMLVDAGSYLLGALSEIRLLSLRRADAAARSPREPADPVSDVDTPTPDASMVGAFAAPFRSAVVGRLLLALLVVTVLNGVALGVLAVFMVRHLGLSTSLVAGIGAGGAVGGVGAGLSTGSVVNRLGNIRAAKLGLALMCLSVVGLPFAPHGLLGIIPCALYEVLGASGGTLFISILFTLVIRSLRPDQLARGMASAAAVPEGGQMLGAALGGVLVAAVGVRPLLYVVAIAASVALLAGGLGLRNASEPNFARPDSDCEGESTSA